MKMRVFLFVKAALLSLPAIAQTRIDGVIDEYAARRNRINIWSGNFDMPWDWRSQRQTR